MSKLGQVDLSVNDVARKMQDLYSAFEPAVLRQSPVRRDADKVNEFVGLV